MGFRFGKSIRLGKHIRLNISKSGLGMSAGVKGFRVGVGPRGTRLTAGIPGTGLSYSKQMRGGSGGRRKSSNAPLQETRSVPPLAMPNMPSPGFFAPQHEKDFVQGFRDFQEGRTEDALRRFLAAGQMDAGGGLYAAVLLASRPGSETQAIAWLESIVRADLDFPTPLMQKYRIEGALRINITPSVNATVPLDGLGAALLLAELYQSQNRLEEAIGVLEEVEEIAYEPVVTLSLCELYAHRGVWEGVIDRAKGSTVTDDVTLETAILYGRALQEKGLHEAASAVFTDALRSKKNRSQQLLTEAAYWRAVSYEILGKRSRASKEFQKLYAKSPDFRDVAHRAASLTVNNSSTTGSLGAGNTIKERDSDSMTMNSRAKNKFCPRCGFAVQHGGNFCSQCGDML